MENFIPVPVKPAKTAVLLRSRPEWRFARRTTSFSPNTTRAGSEEGRLFSQVSVGVYSGLCTKASLSRELDQFSVVI